MAMSTRSSYFKAFITHWQVLAWLLTRPSAWRHYLQSIDPSLSPDFSLYTLRLEQWRNSKLSSLLGAVHLAGPISIGIFTFLWLGIFNQSLDSAIRGGLYVFILSCVGGVSASIMISTAFSAVAATLSGLLIGILFLIETHTDTWYGMAIVAGVFSTGIAGGILVGLSDWTEKSKPLTMMKVLTAMITGVFPIIIVILVLLVFPALLNTLFELLGVESQDAYTLTLAIGILLILGIYLRNWIWSSSIAIVFWLFTTSVMNMSIGSEAHWAVALLVRPFVGGLSNGLLFALLFAIAYLIVRHMLGNTLAGVCSGLIVSGGTYTLLFILNGGHLSLLVWVISAASLGMFITTSKHQVNFTFSVMKLSRGALSFRQIIGRVAENLADVAENLSLFAARSRGEGKIDNPYTGNPIDIQHSEIFVGRKAMLTKIEQHLDASHSTPLLLYGQRRIGKTSLLKQLPRILPKRYLPLFINLQKSESVSSNDSDFFYDMSQQMYRSISENTHLTIPKPDMNDYTDNALLGFDHWLDNLEESTEDQQFVLMLDEFESLEDAFKSHSLDLHKTLSYLRDLLQHRSRFQIIIAGFHLTTELPNWNRYLNNIVDMNVSDLSEAEALRLIERPIPLFVLKYRPSALQHVLSLTRGHPAMIQLLCMEIVNMVNREENQEAANSRYSVTVEDIETALSHNHYFNFFGHMLTQVSEEEEKLLRFIACQGQNVIVSEDNVYQKFSHDTLQNPLRQGTLEYVDGGYRFYLEPIRRYFAEQARQTSS